MPSSERKNKYWSIKQIKKLKPKTVLDVGAGSGDWETILRSNFNYDLKIDAVEIWKPYIERFLLSQKYEKVFATDVGKHKNYNYDLIIFGDILEHMTLREALKCFNRAKKQANFILVSVPTIHHPQGDYLDNPYENHVIEDFTVDNFIESFGIPKKYKSFPVTTVFIYDFS